MNIFNFCVFALVYVLGYLEAFKVIKLYAINFNHIEKITPKWANIDRNWALVCALGSWLSFLLFALQLLEMWLKHDKIQEE